MRFFPLICSIVLLTNHSAAYYEEADPENVGSFQMIRGDLSGGKAEFERLMSYAKMPQYGQCWTDALMNLQAGCQQLTEELQMRLAMEFANCFLKKSGLKTFDCDSDIHVEKCVKAAQAEPNFFTSYLQFFTHTQNICFYVSSELFQKRAEKQVNNLLIATDFVTDNLKKSEKVQEKVLDLQKEALETTVKTSDMQALIHESQMRALANSERALISQQTAIEISEKSQEALKQSFYEMQHSVGETRMWMGDIADRISKLQSVFITEFTGFYSWIFYFVTILFSFLLTSTPRTAGARIWLFLLIGMALLIERFWANFIQSSFEESGGAMPDASRIKEEIGADIHRIRQCFCAIAFAILVRFIWAYQDFNLENARRMTEIMLEIQNLRAALPSNILKRVETPHQTVIGVDSGDGAVTLSMERRRSLSRAPLSSHIIPTRNGSAMSAAAAREPSVRKSITPSRSFHSVNTSRNLTPVPEDTETHGGSRKSTPSRTGTPYRSNPYNLRSSSASREPENNDGNLVSRLIRQFSVEREQTPEQTARDMIDRLAEITNHTRRAMESQHNDSEPEQEE